MAGGGGMTGRSGAGAANRADKILGCGVLLSGAVIIGIGEFPVLLAVPNGKSGFYKHQQILAESNAISSRE